MCESVSMCESMYMCESVSMCESMYMCELVSIVLPRIGCTQPIFFRHSFR